MIPTLTVDRLRSIPATTGDTPAEAANPTPTLVGRFQALMQEGEATDHTETKPVSEPEPLSGQAMDWSPYYVKA